MRQRGDVCKTARYNSSLVKSVKESMLHLFRISTVATSSCYFWMSSLGRITCTVTFPAHSANLNEGHGLLQELLSTIISKN